MKEESPNITSDDESSKRSVRFHDNTKAGDENSKDRDFGDGQAAQSDTIDDATENGNAVPVKRHSTLFHNALRPNSAVRQLFPAVSSNTAPSAPLTHEALRAFEEAKRSHLPTSSISSSDTETDTIRRTIERNALRRSLIKYEPKYILFANIFLHLILI